MGNISRGIQRKRKQPLNNTLSSKALDSLEASAT